MCGILISTSNRIVDTLAFHISRRGKEFTARGILRCDVCNDINKNNKIFCCIFDFLREISPNLVKTSCFHECNDILEMRSPQKNKTNEFYSRSKSCYTGLYAVKLFWESQYRGDTGCRSKSAKIRPANNMQHAQIEIFRNLYFTRNLTNEKLRSIVEPIKSTRKDKDKNIKQPRYPKSRFNTRKDVINALNSILTHPSLFGSVLNNLFKVFRDESYYVTQVQQQCVPKLFESNLTADFEKLSGCIDVPEKIRIFLINKRPSYLLSTSIEKIFWIFSDLYHVSLIFSKYAFLLNQSFHKRKMSKKFKFPDYISMSNRIIYLFVKFFSPLLFDRYFTMVSSLNFFFIESAFKIYSSFVKRFRNTCMAYTRGICRCLHFFSSVLSFQGSVNQPMTNAPFFLYNGEIYSNSGIPDTVMIANIIKKSIEKFEFLFSVNRGSNWLELCQKEDHIPYISKFIELLKPQIKTNYRKNEELEYREINGPLDYKDILYNYHKSHANKKETYRSKKKHDKEKCKERPYYKDACCFRTFRGINCDIKSDLGTHTKSDASHLHSNEIWLSNQNNPFFPIEVEKEEISASQTRKLSNLPINDGTIFLNRPNQVNFSNTFPKVKASNYLLPNFIVCRMIQDEILFEAEFSLVFYHNYYLYFFKDDIGRRSFGYTFNDHFTLSSSHFEIEIDPRYFYAYSIMQHKLFKQKKIQNLKMKETPCIFFQNRKLSRNLVTQLDTFKIFISLGMISKYFKLFFRDELVKDITAKITIIMLKDLNEEMKKKDMFQESAIVKNIAKLPFKSNRGLKSKHKTIESIIIKSQTYTNLHNKNSRGFLHFLKNPAPISRKFIDKETYILSSGRFTHDRQFIKDLCGILHIQISKIIFKESLCRFEALNIYRSTSDSEFSYYLGKHINGSIIKLISILYYSIKISLDMYSLNSKIKCRLPFKNMFSKNKRDIDLPGLSYKKTCLFGRKQQPEGLSQKRNDHIDHFISYVIAQNLPERRPEGLTNNQINYFVYYKPDKISQNSLKPLLNEVTIRHDNQVNNFRSDKILNAIQKRHSNNIDLLVNCLIHKQNSTINYTLENAKTDTKTFKEHCANSFLSRRLLNFNAAMGKSVLSSYKMSKGVQNPNHDTEGLHTNFVLKNRYLLNQLEFFTLKRFFSDDLKICTQYKKSSNELSEKSIELWFLLLECTRYKVPDMDVSIFFSGGVDSIIVTLLILQIIPKTRSVYLINTSICSEKPSKDRISGQIAFNLIKYNHPTSNIFLIENNISFCDYKNSVPTIKSLCFPKNRFMDFNIGGCLYFSSKKASEYSKLVFGGSGADEVFCGYKYHRDCGDLKKLIALDLSYIHNRNLGRDDRVISYFSLEFRHIFLDSRVINFVLNLDKEFLGGKVLLREILRLLGYPSLSDTKKVAMQFGSGLVKYEKLFD